ncbi:MAG TPA: hypothetical protein VK838_02015 [Candidatus Limnocylindrales bacterium]|nr:hypothetical protein [Candidatus Limnocylindrales bacterium]
MAPAGQVHYYVAGADAAGFAGSVGGSDAAAQISQWVSANFRPTTAGGMTLYDLSPTS